MRLADSRWLTDENIHPEVVAHLRGRGLDVLDVRERRWHGRSDDELREEAHRERRIVLTDDGDDRLLRPGAAWLGAAPADPALDGSDVMVSLEELPRTVFVPSR